MATTIIAFLIALLLICAVIYCLTQAATMFPAIPTPLKNIAIVIIFLILFLLLLGWLGYAPGFKFG